MLKTTNQMMQMSNAAAGQVNQMQMEMLAMRGQYERDQLLLEQYDRVGHFYLVLQECY